MVSTDCILWPSGGQNEQPRSTSSCARTHKELLQNSLACATKSAVFFELSWPWGASLPTENLSANCSWTLLKSHMLSHIRNIICTFLFPLLALNVTIFSWSKEKWRSMKQRNSAQIENKPSDRTVTILYLEMIGAKMPSSVPPWAPKPQVLKCLVWNDLVFVCNLCTFSYGL